MKRPRGFTLLEVMMSLVLVLIGMLALFRTLSVASKGSQASQRYTQALARGSEILEAMRTAPPSVLNCLIATGATNWPNCEAQCLTFLQQQKGQVGTPSAQACVFATLSTLKQDRDGTRQQYAVIENPNDPINGSSWVFNDVTYHSVFDAQVTIGWSDDGTAAVNKGCQPLQHCVTLRTSIYRDPQ